jgi:hypothetical protein
LSDLGAEDKAKIGELIKSLALAKSQKREVEKKYEQMLYIKEKEKQQRIKENKMIKAENQEYKNKYEKSKEVIEAYKQSSQIRNSYKDLDKIASDGMFLSNASSRSINITPEPVPITSIPISPIKDTASVSVQTVCDKEIQVIEDNFQIKSSNYLTPSSDLQSQAANNIKFLKNDLFTLSESLKSCNLNSLRASQSIYNKKENDVQPKVQSNALKEDEKIKKLIERTEINKKRGENFKKERNPDGAINIDAFHKLELNLPNQKLSSSPQDKHKSNFKPLQKDKPESITIDHDFYDNNLFQLVDDLERIEEKLEVNDLQYLNPVRELDERSLSSYSDFSMYSKHENSIDSFEELRNRALKLKQTLKY